VNERPIIDSDRLGNAVKGVFHRREQVVGVASPAVAEEPATSNAVRLGRLERDAWHFQYLDGVEERDGVLSLGGLRADRPV